MRGTLLSLRIAFVAAMHAAIFTGLFATQLAAEAEPSGAPSSSPIELSGLVLDPAREPLPGARVEAVPDSGAAPRPEPVFSGSDGRFSLSLPKGGYTLRVALSGFPEVSQRLRVEGENAPQLEIVLGTELSESIVVEAAAGYAVESTSSATRTPTPLRDVPQSVTVVTSELVQDQLMTSIGDVVRYVPGVTLHQGENNRDQVILRGNSSSADFFVDGIRDDAQYYRDLYNLDRIEALKGPNAMIFGRGGGGGVINRVTKEAVFSPLFRATVLGGSNDTKRATVDFAQPLNDEVALRINGVYEDSGSFRDFVGLERAGVAPSLTILAGDATKLSFGYEYFHDERVADRGITSFQGRPADVPIETYYGNPDDSHVEADVQLASAAVTHEFGSFSFSNRTLYGDYDRFYQNYVPGAATADASEVALSAYNNATRRQNFFNQTNLSWSGDTGSIRHTVLVGMEAGRQRTEGFRNTGYFDGVATSIRVPFGDPTTDTPVIFRQSATDADNRVGANVGAIFAQDQVQLSPKLSLLAGVRFDRFDLDYHNNRNGDDIGRVDELFSPRAGVIFRPASELSLYMSYGVSYLPGSGDQFSSLTPITEQLEPEKFENLEVGTKWDLSSRVSLTAALYRLDRTNTRSTDPNDVTNVVQTGSQRTDGFELGANGQLTERWSIAGGYAYQDASITSATVAARKGATVGQVPEHTISLWNNFRFTERFGAALGLVYRSDMFATVDNTVTLPGYTRVDAAIFWSISPEVRLQLNVENLLDEEYFANADSNTNITPGSPVAVRVGARLQF